MHRGFISAIGRPGDGAVFIVSLPLQTARKELPAVELNTNSLS
jgi:hypothetical protein